MFEIKRQVIENTIEISLNGKFTDEHQKAANNFFDLYEFNKIIFHENQGKLKPKTQRLCRFCGESAPKVTFNKVAHSIPQLMGNSLIKNDFECDSCNGLFSKYENELANYMGPLRTLSFLKGQNGLPTYKSPDKKLIIREDNSSIKKIRVITEDTNSDYFKIDEENKKLIFNAIRHPFVPIKVFKIFLKIGYTFLDESELTYYKQLPKILSTDQFDNKMLNHSYFKLLGSFNPGIPFPSPLIISFRKKEDKKHINSPEQGYIINFHNYTYQFFMPFCEKDTWMYGKNKEIEFRIMPPLLDKNWIEFFGKPTYYNLDCSDNKVKKNDPQTITMKFDESIKSQS